MDYEKNKKYFKKTNLFWPIAMMVVSGYALLGKCLSILANFSLDEMRQCVPHFCLWGPLFAGGLILLLEFTVKKVKDKDYDAEIKASLSEFETEARVHLGLQNDVQMMLNPVTFEGYVYEDAIWNIKEGNDMLIRTNHYQKGILFFGNDKIYGYVCKYNTLIDQKSVETMICNYENVVSTAVTSTSDRFKFVHVTFNTFVLNTNNGTSFKCAVSNINDAQAGMQKIQEVLSQKNEQCNT